MCGHMKRLSLMALNYIIIYNDGQPNQQKLLEYGSDANGNESYSIGLFCGAFTVRKHVNCCEMSCTIFYVGK